MTGRVDDNVEARLALRVRGPGGEAEIEVDKQTEAILGDGSEVQFDIHTLDVLWEGEWRPIRAFAGEGGTLVGVSLIEGCRLTVDFVVGGAVRVEPIAGETP